MQDIIIIIYVNYASMQGIYIIYPNMHNYLYNLFITFITCYN